MSRQFFGPGQPIRFGDKRYTIRFKLDSGFMVVDGDGKSRTISEREFFDAYNSGELSLAPEDPEAERKIRILTPEEHEKAQFLLAYLEPLKASGRPGSLKAQEAVIREVSKKLEHSPEQRPSASKIYFWWRKWQASGFDIMSLVPRNPLLKRESRVARDLDALIFECIQDVFLKRKGGTPKEAFEELKCRCDDLGIPEADRPSQSTFYRRVQGIDPLTKEIARHGYAAARMRARLDSEMFMTQKPLERVELDTIHITLVLTDDHGTPLGKVIVFLAIDVHTRCVLGASYKVGKNPSEDAEGYIDALKMVCRYKPKSDFVDVENDWIAYGLPTEVIVDPGTALTGKALADFAMVAGITRGITPAGAPHYKPHVESFFKGLRARLLEKIDSYVRKNAPDHVKQHAAEKMASMPVRDFEQCLYKFIIDDYQHTPHEGLDGFTPHEAWCEALKLRDVDIARDMTLINAFHANTKKPVLNPNKGVHVNDLYYNSRDLQNLYRRLVKNWGDKVKVRVHWSSRDLSRVSVFDPTDNTLLEVPCKQNVEPGTTKTEFDAYRKEVKERLNRKRPNSVNEKYGPIQKANKFLKAKEQNKRKPSQPDPTEAAPQSVQDLEDQLNTPSVSQTPQAEPEIGQAFDQPQRLDPVGSEPTDSTPEKPQKFGTRKRK